MNYSLDDLHDEVSSKMSVLSVPGRVVQVCEEDEKLIVFL